MIYALEEMIFGLSGNLVWKYEVEKNENNEAINFSLHLPSFDVRTGNLSRFWKRIWQR